MSRGHAKAIKDRYVVQRRENRRVAPENENPRESRKAQPEIEPPIARRVAMASERNQRDVTGKDKREHRNVRCHIRKPVGIERRQERLQCDPRTERTAYKEGVD